MGPLTSSASDAKLERRVNRLVVAMKGKDWKQRDKISEQLAALGEPAIPFLLSALKVSSWSVREGIVIALREIGWRPQSDEERILYLIGRWNQDKALHELLSFGPAAVEHIIPLLDDERESARQKAATILGEIGGPRAVEALIGLLEDESGCPGWVIIGALRDIAVRDFGCQEAVEPLLRVLQDTSRRSSDRASAAGALGWLQDQRAVGPLVDALADKHAEVRFGAAESLRILRWQPTDLDQSVNYALASRDWETLCWLVNTYPELLRKVVIGLIELEELKARQGGEDFGYREVYDTGADTGLPEGAIRALIRFGNRSFEEALVGILNQCERVFIAEDFLNCGNPRLVNAAKEWASRRRYQIGERPGSSRVILRRKSFRARAWQAGTERGPLPVIWRSGRAPGS